MRADAQPAMRPRDPVPLYAVAAAGGDLLLVELQLVAPELFFRLAPDAASRLVDALLR